MLLGIAPRSRIRLVVTTPLHRVSLGSPWHLWPCYRHTDQRTAPSGSRYQLPPGHYSPISPVSFPANPAIYPSHVPEPLEMNFSVSSWGVPATSSPTDESVGDCHVQYQRAPPTPVYHHILSPYQVQSMSPVPLHCVLPNGQIQFLPPEGQTDDVISKKTCYQTTWALQRNFHSPEL